MKNLIIAALIGTLTETQAIQLENIQHIKLQKINILAQTSTSEEPDKKELALGPLGEAETEVTKKILKLDVVSDKIQRNPKKEEDEKPSAPGPNSSVPGPDAGKPTSEVGGVKFDKETEAIESKIKSAAEMTEAEDEKVAKVEKTPALGEKEAAAEIKISEELALEIKSFPTVFECAPYQDQMEHGLTQATDKIGKPFFEQNLLGKCIAKWQYIQKNPDWKPQEPNLEVIAKEKAESEALAVKTEWHANNWNMGRNQHDDEVKAIIEGHKAQSIAQQQKIESFIIFPTDTPDEMEVKKANIEKRNIEQLAQAKAEFDAQLAEAGALKTKAEADKKISDEIQAKAEADAEKEKAAYAKKVADAEVVENQAGLDMKEVINARKEMNQARIDELDKERFEYAKKIRDEAEESQEKVHAEFKSVAAAMEYAKERRLNWSKSSMKTTNDEVWTENMPAYILSQTNPEMRAIMEKEYRMAAAKNEGGDEKKEKRNEDKTEEKKEEKKDEKKEEKKDNKTEEAKNATAEEEKAPEPEKKEEKKEPKKLSAKDQAVETMAAGVQDSNTNAAKNAGESDDQMYYADFKAEMQNKRDQRVAVAAKWVAPTLANIQV